MASRWPTHCGGHAEWAGTVALLAIVMTVAPTLLIQRSRYARPVYLAGMALTAISDLLIDKFTESNGARPFWPVVVNPATAGVVALYLYASKAVRKYFSTYAPPSELPFPEARNDARSLGVVTSPWPAVPLPRAPPGQTRSFVFPERLCQSIIRVKFDETSGFIACKRNQGGRHDNGPNCCT
jgi:hypothetical protein